MNNGPYISLNEAAKLTGRAKSTISKALKNGKMSYVSKDSKTGAYEIDPAEAKRVFPKKRETVECVHHKNTKHSADNSVLQAKFEALDQRFSDAQATIEDLRKRLDVESTERRQLTAILTDQREQSIEFPKRGFWARLIGRQS